MISSTRSSASASARSACDRDRDVAQLVEEVRKLLLRRPARDHTKSSKSRRPNLLGLAAAGLLALGLYQLKTCADTPAADPHDGSSPSPSSVAGNGPVDVNFPGGDRVPADPDSAAFFQEMERRGFEYVLSEEDTGRGARNHVNGTATEWWVAFYKPGRVEPATDLPSGFLSSPRAANEDFVRVPYAFPLRTLDGSSTSY